ncbi:protein asteroid 1-like protein [Anopheles sinensis]|uniref:Protein asteroid 1-like protein n=1 Tax=Anopheles sinensis TaxID=74873 RepID=A0A084WFD3_ANOSI|nr:protein asteroid 1-like protein [Anopheles sinensis]
MLLPDGENLLEDRPPLGGGGPHTNPHSTILAGLGRKIRHHREKATGQPDAVPVRGVVFLVAPA